MAKNRPGPIPNTSDEEIIDAVRNGDTPVLTTRGVADALPISRRAVSNRLNRLHDEGSIERMDVGPKAKVWWVEDDGEPFQSSEAVGVPDDDELPGPNAPKMELLTAIDDVIAAKSRVENRRQRIVRVLNKYDEDERVCEFCQQKVDRDVLEAIRDDKEERQEELEQLKERLETTVEDRDD